jgi:PAS domain S-box-containing protein
MTHNVPVLFILGNGHVSLPPFRLWPMFSQQCSVQCLVSRMAEEVKERGRVAASRLADPIAKRASSICVAEDNFFHELVNALPAAIYTTDAEGRITYFNEAAVELWGHRPELGRSEWCGSWKLFWPDGRRMPHDQCPMAVAVKERRSVRGLDAVSERPDGTRIPFIPFPTPIFNSDGQFVGAVNLLVDISERKLAEDAMYRLAAIVETSDDAIVAKNLQGIITNWNKGAERIFGYLAEEIVGKSIKVLIPPEYQSEEDTILERLRRGERIDHYETVRQRKHGDLFDVSLTISPIKDANGHIIGASKIARDITERKRFEKQLALLGREAEHRSKNILATVQAAVHLTRADSVDGFKSIIGGRIQALANVNTLFAQSRWTGADLRTLIEHELAAFSQGGNARVYVDGPNLILEPDAAQAIAVSVHELTTNAAKYGALSSSDGRINVVWSQSAGELTIHWVETGAPTVAAPNRKGFGTTIIERMMQDRVNGTVKFDWRDTGLCCTLVLQSDFHLI